MYMKVGDITVAWRGFDVNRTVGKLAFLRQPELLFNWFMVFTYWVPDTYTLAQHPTILK
jgi:hypothetical protein